MSSIQNLREFISERLNVAAGEIFAVVERTIVRYEERTERRQEMTGRPRGRFHGAEKPQHVCKEEQLWNQETSSSPDQENPEAPGCKEEEEEELKQESDPFVEPPAERGSEHSEELLSHNSVRSFINVRLSAAAVEIFSVFEQTMVQYEEQLDGHPRVLDPTETAHIQPHAADCPQQHVCKENRLCQQERTSSLCQEEPAPLQIKEEQEEHWTVVELFTLKQETDDSVLTPADCPQQHVSKGNELCNQERTSSLCQDSQLKEEQEEHWTIGQPVSLKQETDDSEPTVSLQPQDDPQQLVSQEHRLCNQERTSSLCKEEPAPPQIEEELETDDYRQPSTGNKRDCREPKPKVTRPKKKRKKQHLCSECGKSFLHESHLVVHKRIHNGEKPHTCPECNKSFTQKSSLVTHQRIHQNEKPYSCPECGKCFRQKGTLQVHQRTHRGEKPYSCPACGKSFNQKYHLVQHRRTHTSERPYVCPVCGKGFSRKSGLRIHQRTHTGEKPYCCEECGRSFNQRCSLVAHTRTHTGERPYSCTECGKSFSQSTTLVKHTQTHTDDPQQLASQENGLCNHKRTSSLCKEEPAPPQIEEEQETDDYRQPSTGNKRDCREPKPKKKRKKQHLCSECGKSFFHESHLVVHKRIHNGEKPHTCPECNKSFTQKSSLVTHQRIHQNEKPYSCPECGKCFRQKGTLQVHQRTHRGEKPYSCPVCGKSFSQKYDLVHHGRTHTSERPYVCPECGKGFSRKSSLKIHQRTHTGEKPYSCEDCGRSFNQRCSLVAHTRTHTGERPYSCTECGKSFSQSTTLVKHTQTHMDESY